jgi:aryl-alcohol dehydrogenase-like predicted oxidoreductase
MSTTKKVPDAAAAGRVSFGDLAVNRLGFGAMRITGEGIWGEPRDVAEAKRVLARLVELGVTLIDTADSYGPHVSERLIGETLFPYPKGLVIATKGGYTRSGPNQWTPDGRPEHLREACEGSLKRLRLERIDVYQLHNVDPKVPLAESVGALAALQREGKIRHIGVSNFSVAQLGEARGMVAVVSVQNRYNLRDRASEPVLRECERLGIPFLPWAPLGRAKNDAAEKALGAVAARHGATAGQIAIAALLAQSPVMLPIPGTSRVAHLEENVAAASIELSSRDREELGVGG